MAGRDIEGRGLARGVRRRGVRHRAMRRERATQAICSECMCVHVRACAGPHADLVPLHQHL